MSASPRKISCESNCASTSPRKLCCKSVGAGPGDLRECDPLSGALGESGQTMDPHFLVSGTASGPILVSHTTLSIWMGVRPSSGEIIDHHHPLRGQNIAGTVLALPRGRGSCASSLGILECIQGSASPAALILEQPDPLLALGVLIAHVLFGSDFPVIVLGPRRFSQLTMGSEAKIDQATNSLRIKTSDKSVLHIPLSDPPNANLTLEKSDQDLLSGSRGSGVQQAMSIVVSMAKLYGVERLVSVTQAHIDAIVYTGPAVLAFARHFVDLNCVFSVPTTLNAMSVDYERWEEQGVPPEEADGPCKLADALVQMGGSTTSFTCAPYLLPTAPAFGEQIGWSESNAVMYANSVLGARTLKYPDMLDCLIALTGRAPLGGCHTTENRLPTMHFSLDRQLSTVKDSIIWPLLGYHLGNIVGEEIPIVCGWELSSPRESDLKAFGAALATSSSAPMFHIRGVTPETPTDFDDSYIPESKRFVIASSDLKAAWEELNSATTATVGAVCLGNPHLSLDEFEELARLTRGRKRHNSIPLILTCGRWILDKASEAGYLAPITAFGAQIMTDTCWCFINEPVVPVEAETIMTNSGKYAHYGPGWIGKPAHFNNAAACVEAAVTGHTRLGLPDWMRGVVLLEGTS